MDSFKKKVINKIEKLIKTKGEVVLGLATGSTPLPIYDGLIKKHKEGELDFSKVKIFHLDEYVGISKENPHSYQYYLKDNFLEHINIDPENCYFLNGTADNLKKEAERYEELIKKEGGIDFQILGVGRDGHIGFNEPVIQVDDDFLENPDKEEIKKFNKFILKLDISQQSEAIQKISEIKEETRKKIEKELPNKEGRKDLVERIKNQEITFFVAKNQLSKQIEFSSEKIKIKDLEEAFNSSTHVEELALPTLKDNSRFYGNLKTMETKALTLGLGTILNAKQIVLLASGGRKAKIMKKVLENPVSIRYPASLLRNHSNTSFILDDAAGSLLSLDEQGKSFKEKIKTFLTKKYLSLSNKKRYLTVDLGGTYCRASLRDQKGKLLSSSVKVKTLASEGVEIILNQILKTVLPLLKIGNPEKTKILLATAGKVNEKEGIIKESKNLELTDFDLKRRVEENLPTPHKGIRIVNDLVAAWYGEKKLKETSNFVSFYASTGIGGAFKNNNLEPGWTIAVSLDEDDKVKNARFIGEKVRGGFYKKEDLKKNEYFLEELAGGPALVSFAKENASAFPKSDLARKIKREEIKDIPQKLSEKAKENDSFARYCLKKTGEYAGIGIVTLFNHFFESKKEVSFNERTRFFINGPTGLDSFYFEGIKLGVGKGNELFDNNLSPDNVLRSGFNNSTEGVQKGLIYYHQNLIKGRKEKLPPSDNNVIISDEEIPPKVKSWPLVEKRKVAVLEEEEGDADLFAGNLINKLKEKNEVKKIKKIEDREEIDLLLAPEGKEIDFEGPILFYKTFPQEKEDLKINAYFEFDSSLSNRLKEAITAYKEEIKRVRYDISSKFLTKYYGELLNLFSISEDKFAHPFKAMRVSKGKKEAVEGISSLRSILEKKEGENVFISPHADDAEIGAGALMRWLVEEKKSVQNWIITESHNESKRRREEAQKAREILSTDMSRLKLEFMGFNKEKLREEKIKEKIEYQIKDIEKLDTLFLPSLKDFHPTHSKVREIIEEMFLEHFDDFLIVYYLTPWVRDYNTYYPSNKNYGKGKKGKIAALFKKATGRSGILGELCGEFKNEGFAVKFVEEFKRKNNQE